MQKENTLTLPSRQAPARLTRWDWLALALLFAAALVVRLVGIQHGTPLLTHPDEPTMLNPVIAMTRNGTLNPDHFSWPTQFLYRFYHLYLNALSRLRFGVNLSESFGAHTEYFHYAARRVVAVFGALQALAAYLVGREFKPNFALPAGLLFAFFPAYVQHAHFAAPDVPITLYTLLILLFCLRFLNSGKKVWIGLALLFAAINTADKYPGAISLALIFGALLIAALQRRTSHGRAWFGALAKQGLLALLVYFVLLFAVAPFLFLDIKDVIAAFANEARSTHLGSDGLGWLGNLRFYLANFLSDSNLLLSLFILPGVYGLLKSHQPKALLLTYGLLYFLLLSVLALHQERWSLPMVISPLLLSASGMAYLLELSAKKRALRAAAFILAAAALLLTVLSGAAVSTNLALTDTRAAGLDFALKNGISEANTLYEGYTPFEPRGIPKIYTFNWDAPHDYDYLMLSSLMYDRYLAEAERYTRQAEFYRQAKVHTVLLASFEPHPQPNKPLLQADSVLHYLKRRLGLPVEQRFTGPSIQIYQFIKE